jgi:hypothetical protein
MEDWLQAVHEKFYTGLLLVDFAKAFDSVHHGVLLRRLKSYGISNTWFNSYLDHRKQQVVCAGALSEEAEIRAGVPQGSVLGPLLFCVVINDLPNALPSASKVGLYADDATIMCRSNDITVVEAQLNEVAGQCVNWATKNRMRINADKTKLMVLGTNSMKTYGNLNVTMDETRLEQVGKARILGFELCANPTQVDDMVRKQCGKMKTAVELVERASQYIPARTTKLMCNAFVRPHAIFCNTVWGPLTSLAQRRRMDTIAVRCGRLVWGKGLNRSEYLTTMGWFGTKSQIDYNVACEVYKSLCGRCPTYLQNKFKYLQSQTRAGSQGTLAVPRTHKASFSHYGSAVYNSQPVEARAAATLGVFKTKAYAHFKSLDNADR